MTTAEQPTSDGSSEIFVSLRTIAELLETRQYEQVAALLDKARLANKRANHIARADILAAAQQICLACSQCQAEKTWHQQAYGQSDQREDSLKQYLQAILNLLGDGDGAEAAQKQAKLPPHPTTELSSAEAQTSPAADRLSLWQHIQNLLGRGLSFQHFKQEEATELAESQVTSSFEGDEAPSVPFPVEIEAPVSPLVEKDEVLATSPGEEIEASLASPTEEAEIRTSPFTKEAEVSATVSAEEAEVPPAIKKLETSSPPVSEQIEATDAAVSDKVQTPLEPLASEEIQAEPSLPSLVVYCLGSFRVYQDDRPVKDWASSKGKMVFKYLVTHRKRPIAKEVLMGLFWPDASPDAARNNLNVAIYGLRQTLRMVRPDLSHVLFREDYYLLNPELQTWVDVEAFEELIKTAQNLELPGGDLAAAIRQYRAAEALYPGEFLAEDRYEDWLLPQRQHLEANYLKLLERLTRYYLDQENYDACATMCDKILTVDPCREEAHRRLMRCYSRQGQRYLALRQYHLCCEVLAQELDVGPSQPTIALCEQIRQR